MRPALLPVAELVADSLNNQEVADRLCYTLKTAERLVSELYGYFGIDSRSGGNRPKLADACREYLDQERLFGE